ncbi:MAG: type II secretion system major pseudopilin GspG [Desulfobacterales bacterium]|nr:type II secretion system major pseudopilin GspG [Desulfobacterales bacterium]
MEKRNESKNKEKGFTLIELLIVMIILGLLAALVGPPAIKKLGQSKTKATKAQITLLETSLDMFRMDVGRYPTTEEGLNALVQKSQNIERWDGPYLKKGVPNDPWGKPYQYKCPGEHGDFDIISYGADGKIGGDDENCDISSWENVK